MTIKIPGSRGWSRSLRTIERPTITLPTIERPTVHRVELSRLHVPELPDMHMPNVDMPNIDLSHIDVPDIDLAGVGRAVTGALSDIAGNISVSLSDAGDRARGAVISMSESLPADLPLISRMRPKPRSGMVQKVAAVAIASTIGVALAGIAVFFAPGSGARRRATLRRRLRGTPAAAQRAIGTATGAARQVGDRAVELVRIPVETASHAIGRNGSTPDEASTADDAARTAEGSGRIGDTESAIVDAEAHLTDPSDLAVVEIAAGTGPGTYTDADAAGSIYQDDSVITDDVGEASPEIAEYAEAQAGTESQGA